jgi:hypothetical protein
MQPQLFLRERSTKQNFTILGCWYFIAKSTPIPELPGDRDYNIAEHCECTLRNSISAIDTNGICFLPHGSFMKKYVDSIKYSLKNGASQCHSLDRRNLKSQLDCGSGRDNFNAWSDLVEREFNFTYWP